MRILSIIILFSFFGCSSADKRKLLTDNQHNKQAASSSSSEKGKQFHKLEKLTIIGDFNGDGKRDTIFQHNFSRFTQQEIDSCPDPFHNDRDTVVRWFDKQNADVYLAFSKPGLDTLHLGWGQGLYCLLNIGDNNSDGKDEIALVVDYCDFSMVNSCKIFSVCNSKWRQLKRFDINEGAFVFSSDTIPTFKNIKGFLVQRGNKWVYADYHDQDYEASEDVTKMSLLTLDKCQ